MNDNSNPVVPTPDTAPAPGSVSAPIPTPVAAAPMPSVVDSGMMGGSTGSSTTDTIAVEPEGSKKGFYVVVALLIVAIVAAGVYALVLSQQTTEDDSTVDPTPTLTNPDVTSDEDTDIGTYDGVEVGTLPEGYVTYEEWMTERAHPDNETQLAFTGTVAEDVTIEVDGFVIEFTGSDFLLSMTDTFEGEVVAYDSEPTDLFSDPIGDFLRWKTNGADIYQYADKITTTADSHDSAGNCMFLGDTIQKPCGADLISFRLGAADDLQNSVAFHAACTTSTEAGLAKCDQILKDMSVSEL
jgi:hypothetical protein